MSEVLIREAKPDDAAGIARAHVDSWHESFRGILPDEFLAGITYEDREPKFRNALADGGRHEFFYVAEGGAGRIVGFASGGPAREGVEGFDGELYAIYLVAEWKRRGVGRRLALAVVEELVRRGFRSMLVWVLTVNPARLFYEALGGTFLREGERLSRGHLLPVIAYGWADIGALIERLRASR